MASTSVEHSSPPAHKRRKSSEDSGKSIQAVLFKPQAAMKGLGIRGLTEEETAVVESTNGDESDVTKGEFSTSQDNLTPYLPLYGSPSPPSPRSSGPTHEVMNSPQTPAFSNSYSQYGSGLNKFKSQVHSPTPTKRSEEAKANRPMLMRTPPSDHPISGIQVLTRYDDDGDDEDDDLEKASERDERRSSVAELPPSPARLAFGRVPASPSSPNTPTSPRSPATLSPDRFHFRQSLSHRIHARDLSTFFPRPGQSGPPQSPGAASNGRFVDAPVTDIPYKAGAKAQRNGAESLKAWTFGQPSAQQDGLVPQRSPSVDASASAIAPPPSPGRVGRRGHHHKHSLSHNFFSFLDPTATDPSLNSATSPSTDASSTESSIPRPSAIPKPVPTAFIQGSTSEGPSSTSSPLLPYPSQQVRSGSLLGFLFSLAPLAQLALSLGLLEFFVGASLWVDGQAFGSVSITGLGYMVVYDAIGVGIRVLGSIMRTGEGSQSSLRRPFGTHRIESLLYFVQAIFLLFACVYIAKESVEHLLLEGHHHHGTGAHEDHYDLEFPVNLLISGIIASLFASLKLQNHAVLVEVVGSEVLGQTKPPKRSTTFTGLPTIFSNPFTLAVAGTCSFALIGSLILPVHQLDSLDKALSMLETFLCYRIAYPAAVAFGTVLLQTAPAGKTLQMTAFDNAIKEITRHHSVIKVASPHVWQLTPFQPEALVDDTPYASPAHSRRTSLADGVHSRQTTPKPAQFAEMLKQVYPERRRSSGVIPRGRGVAGKSGGCILVATVVVHVVEEAGDATILEITKLAYERCAEAMGLSRNKKREGEWEMGGELTIAVRRGEGERREEKEEEGHGRGVCDGGHAGHEKENGHHHQHHHHHHHDKHDEHHHDHHESDHHDAVNDKDE